MGSGPARSSRMAAMARRWAPVSAKGRPVDEPVRPGSGGPVVTGDHVADAAGVALQPVLAEDQGQLQPEQLVEGQPAAGRLASRPSVAGRWMWLNAVVRSTRSNRSRHAVGHRVGEDPGPVEGLAHVPADAGPR